MGVGMDVADVWIQALLRRFSSSDAQVHMLQTDSPDTNAIRGHQAISGIFRGCPWPLSEFLIMNQGYKWSFWIESPSYTVPHRQWTRHFSACSSKTSTQYGVFMRLLK